jgi:inner membrane transporter RhtA
MYIVFGKRVSTLASGQAVSLGMLVAALFALPIGIANAGAAMLAPTALLTGLGVALLSSAVPYSLEMAALRRLPRHVFGILVSATPAVGAACGAVVLGERLSGLQWLAIACIVGACAGGAATGSRADAGAAQA